MFDFLTKETRGKRAKKCRTCKKLTDERVSHVAELFKNMGTVRSSILSLRLSFTAQHYLCHAKTCKDLKCIKHRLSRNYGLALIREARELLKRIIQGHRDKKWELVPFELEEAKRLLREYPEPALPKKQAA
ncbi:hypothetical protein HY406_00945 [Candidatus Giovannonibacteria bacterium]|nr:hypothetical protein [Candidatus Giovannonibacteria bacterium]